MSRLAQRCGHSACSSSSRSEGQAALRSPFSTRTQAQADDETIARGGSNRTVIGRSDGGESAGSADRVRTTGRGQDRGRAQTYSEYCSTCHGDNLVNSGVTFDLRRLKATERARFENSVRNGKNQMPPWNGVLN